MIDEERVVMGGPGTRSMTDCSEPDAEAEAAALVVK